MLMRWRCRVSAYVDASNTDGVVARLGQRKIARRMDQQKLRDPVTQRTAKSRECYLCLRNELLPMCPEYRRAVSAFWPALCQRNSSRSLKSDARERPPTRYALRRDSLRLEPEAKAGGEKGIRTLGTVSRTHAFQACSLNHSDISPFEWNQ